MFFAKNWSQARQAYEMVLKKAPDNALAWNRLGFSNHNLSNYEVALQNYRTSLSYHPSTPLQTVVQTRMACIYAIRQEKDQAFNWFNQAIAAGYSNFPELETERELANLREDSRFKTAYEQTKTNAFPCVKIPEARQFDFWIGEWNVQDTKSGYPVGQSSIQLVAGDCLILENWTALGVPNNGKSMNYYDPQTRKWEQVWVGSEGGGVQKYVNGEYKDGAMRFTYETTEPDGKKVTGHFIFYNQGKNQVRQYQDKSYDNGATSQVVYDFTYIRK